MSPTDQIIAIAAHCGWHVECDGPPDYTLVGLHPQKHEADDAPVVLPDYLNDLNAMRQAEGALSYEQKPIYVHTLKFKVMMCDEGVSDFDFMHATATQRAEALLRTIGKWKEGA